MNAVDLKSFLMELTQKDSLQPTPDKTFCNIAAREIANKFDCHEFDNEALLADDMINIMRENVSGNWLMCDGYNATKFSMDGCLVFAGKTGKELEASHGHIAAVVPLPMAYSGSLNKSVPQIANVGRRNGIMKVTEAFPVAKGEPNYFKYK